MPNTIITNIVLHDGFMGTVDRDESRVRVVNTEQKMKRVSDAA